MPLNIFWYGCWSAVRYMVRKPWICASDYRPVSLTLHQSSPHTVLHSFLVSLTVPHTVSTQFLWLPSSPPHTVASLNVIVRTAECRLGEGMALDALGWLSHQDDHHHHHQDHHHLHHHLNQHDPQDHHRWDLHQELFWTPTCFFATTRNKEY